MLQALMFATSTVMVSCPCALGLAAPLALVAGVGVAARSGVLIKSAQVLEAGDFCALTHARPFADVC
jgi:Cu+-exporting ATPase